MDNKVDFKSLLARIEKMDSQQDKEKAVHESFNKYSKLSDSNKPTSNTGVSGTISSISSFVKALDTSNRTVVQFDKNLLDMTADFTNFVSSIVSMDFSKIMFSMSEMAKPFLEVDSALRNQVNKSLGLTGNLARNLRTDIIEVSEDTMKYGIEMSQVTDTYTSFVTELGRAQPISRELATNMLMVSKGAGVSASQAGTFLAKLEGFGVGLEKGPDTLKEMAGTARTMGLTTNKFMAYAAENLKMINTLGFDKGIQGFTKIAAKASSIGFNLSTAQASAEKLFDIDGAVEMAAQLNVLGGDFGRLGNAIDLMFMPTNDMEGFTNSLLDATKQFVSFNSEKNSFDVSPLDLRRAREFAKATGMSIEEVIESGKRLSKMEVIKDKISFLPNLSEEERVLIGNLGSINDNGDVTIKGKVVNDMKSNEITDALRSIKQENNKGKMTEKDILNEQLNMFSKMNYYLKAIALQIGGGGDNGGLFNVLGDDLNDLVYSIVGEDSEKRDLMMDNLSSMFVKGDTSGVLSKLSGKVETNEQQTIYDSIKRKMESVQAESAKWNSAKSKMSDGVTGSLKGAVIKNEVHVAAPNVSLYVDGVMHKLSNDQRKALNELTVKYKMSKSNQGDTSTNFTKTE